MNRRKNLIICGFMGVGKSVAGKAVSNVLGLDFIDTDELIERKQNKSVADIFHENGEECFRAIEKTIVSALPGFGAVIAVGGGMIVDPESFESLSGKGIMILLTATAETICRRIRAEETRPLLSGDDLKTRVEKLISQRRAVYDKILIRIATDNLSVEEVCGETIVVYEEKS